MSVKRIIALLIAVALIGGLVGCRGKSADRPTPASPTNPASDETDTAWSAEGAVAGKLPSACQTAFEQAVKGLDGVSYSPLACIGVQIVAGENYAILAKSTVVAPDAVPQLAVMTVFASLHGDATLTDVKSFSLDPLTADGFDLTAGAPRLGGYGVPPAGKDGLTAMPQQLATASAEAFSAYADLSLDPLACAATRQADGGTEYAMVCRGTGKDGSGVYLAVVRDDGKEAAVRSVHPIGIGG